MSRSSASSSGGPSRYSGPDLPNAASIGAEAAERLRALGYSAGSIRNPQSAAASGRPDPKDRRELAARIAQITSGELTGAALVSALEAIVRDDPRNGQAHLRLAYARLQAGDCARAEPEFHAAASSGLPSADIYLGLATCLGRRRDLAGAERALNEARRLEPDNASVTANLGLLQAEKGEPARRDRGAERGARDRSDPARGPLQPRDCLRKGGAAERGGNRGTRAPRPVAPERTSAV